jgi:hypothetical protein
LFATKHLKEYSSSWSGLRHQHKVMIVKKTKQRTREQETLSRELALMCMLGVSTSPKASIWNKDKARRGSIACYYLNRKKSLPSTALCSLLTIQVQ